VVQAPPGQAETAAEVLTVLRKGTDDEDGQIVVGAEHDLAGIAEQWGVMPLPPYIQRAETTADEDAQDRQRYQTVYAAADASGAGSVAAPTAGLHFSDETLARLKKIGVTTSRVCLHVGPGTFKPPSEDQIKARRLHREFFHLPAGVSRELAETRHHGGRVIAVGTTALRVLETVQRLGLTEDGPDQRIFESTAQNPVTSFRGEAQRCDGHWEVSGETRLFISPPDTVTAADGLLTNFHLPGSSLLMLVASLMGPAIWQNVYDQAVQMQMRFYSYGDCMLILPGVGDASDQKPGATQT